MFDAGAEGGVRFDLLSSCLGCGCALVEGERWGVVKESIAMEQCRRVSRHPGLFGVAKDLKVMLSAQTQMPSGQFLVKDWSAGRRNGGECLQVLCC